MKNFLIVIFLFHVSLSNAQHHLVGIKGGINWSNINVKEGFVDTKYKTGGVFGLSYEYQFKNNFVIGSDLMNMQRGFVLESYYYDQQGNPIGEDEVPWNYNYIALPIKGGCIFGNKVTGFMNLGLIPSYVIKANVKLPEFAPEDDTDITNRITKFDLAGLAEFGGNILVATNLYLTASVSFQYSFTTFTKQDFFENQNMKHYGFTVLTGIKYIINGE